MATKQPLVLLVDDEEDLCLLMQMTLARMGIKTHLAYRVEQAKNSLPSFSTMLV
jgi:two-component system response regulator PilR (NtrC family)